MDYKQWRSWRLRLGVTQSRVGMLMWPPRDAASICRYETGQVTPTPETAREIERALARIEEEQMAEFVRQNEELVRLAAIGMQTEQRRREEEMLRCAI